MVKRLQDENTSLKKKSEKYLEELKDKKNLIAEMNKKNDDLKLENNELRNENDVFNEDNKSLKERNKEIQSALRKKDEALFCLESKNKSLDREKEKSYKETENLSICLEKYMKDEALQEIKEHKDPDIVVLSYLIYNDYENGNLNLDLSSRPIVEMFHIKNILKNIDEKMKREILWESEVYNHRKNYINSCMNLEKSLSDKIKFLDFLVGKENLLCVIHLEPTRYIFWFLPVKIEKESSGGYDSCSFIGYCYDYGPKFFYLKKDKNSCHTDETYLIVGNSECRVTLKWDCKNNIDDSSVFSNFGVGSGSFDACGNKLVDFWGDSKKTRKFIDCRVYEIVFKES